MALSGQGTNRIDLVVGITPGAETKTILMAEKIKRREHTTEVNLHPPAAIKMTDSDEILILMSHIVKCVMIIIKVLVKLPRSSEAFRTAVL